MSRNPALAVTDHRTVLVVESDYDVRSLTRILLSKRGYRVLEAYDAEAAFDVAASRPGRVDLLISRLAAAGLPGPDLAQRMRIIYPALKVLFVAERSCDPSVRQVLRKRETELISRPYSLRDMANRVGALMAAAS